MSCIFNDSIPIFAPQDLSGIERLYNSENTSPSNKGQPLTTSANTQTLTRKVGEPFMVGQTPLSLLHDSLTIITRDKPSSDLGAPDFQTVARTAITIQPSAQPRSSSVKEGFFDQFCDGDCVTLHIVQHS